MYLARMFRIFLLAQVGHFFETIGGFISRVWLGNFFLNTKKLSVLFFTIDPRYVIGDHPIGK